LDKTALGKYKYEGIGNNENWLGQYPKGPSEWFAKMQESGQLSRNPLDLLSACLMIQHNQQQTTTENVINIYEKISEELPVGYEMHTSMGNAYYNGFQYLRAEEQYLKALKLKKTEKLYEYMAWIKS
jgi:hypothetical protein